MGDQEYQIIDERTVQYKGKKYRLYAGPLLQGKRQVIEQSSELYPSSLLSLARPPKRLYLIGDARALQEGLAVIGARKATPYGCACTKHFARLAAERGITIISGGALGCDSYAHRATLEENGKTVVFLGGGCDQLYPTSNYQLFQEVIDKGGAVVSENHWSFPALPYTFRERNRLIAGLAKAVLIVEAGMPSGTFSTADEALAANKEVLVVPGAITSKTSLGSNMLLYQGATPVINDESFQDILFSLFTTMKSTNYKINQDHSPPNDSLLEALQANPMTLEEIYLSVSVPSKYKNSPMKWLNTHLVELEKQGYIKRYPDSRYGPATLK